MSGVASVNHRPTMYGTGTKGKLGLTIFFVSHTQNDLWRSVIACDHIWGHLEPCSRCPGQTKVQDLQGTVRLHNYITRLQILKEKCIFEITN